MSMFIGLSAPLDSIKSYWKIYESQEFFLGFDIFSSGIKFIGNTWDSNIISVKCNFFESFLRGMQ